MNRGMRLALLLCSALAASCQVTEIHQTARPTPVARTAQAERAWRVVDDGQEVGTVVLFRSKERGEFFSVRNGWHQDLGIVDELGRAWVFRPHEEDPVWLGSGTVTRGAERILGTSGECRLVEVSLADLEAVPASSPATTKNR